MSRQPRRPRPSATDTSNGKPAAEPLDLPQPQSIEAEQAVLGSMLLDNEVIHDVMQLLTPGCFLRDAHQKMARIIFEAQDQGEAIDSLLLREKLKRRGWLEEIGQGELTTKYIADVLDEIPTAANAEYYARIVRDCWIRRRRIDIGNRLVREGHEPSECADAVLDAEAELAELREGPGTTERFRLQSIDSAQLYERARKKPTWLIRPLLVLGQPCILGGPRKTLKTSVLIDLAISLGSARQFLGEFYVPEQRRVLVMSGESGEWTIGETASRVAQAKRFLLTESWVRWEFTLPQLSRADHLAELRRHITEHKIEVAILDPAYLCLLAGNADAQAGNMFDMGPLLSNVARVCLGTGCTPILAHHFTMHRKTGNPYDPPDLEELAFSGFQEFARQWLLLGRRQQYVPGTGEHRLWLVAGGSAGFGGQWAVDVNEGTINEEFEGRTWSVTVNTATEARQEQHDDIVAKKEKTKTATRDAKDRADLRRVRDALARYRDGVTAARLAARCGMGGARCAAVAEMLVESGDADYCDVEVNCGTKGTRVVPGIRPAHPATPGDTTPAGCDGES